MATYQCSVCGSAGKLDLLSNIKYKTNCPTCGASLKQEPRIGSFAWLLGWLGWLIFLAKNYLQYEIGKLVYAISAVVLILGAARLTRFTYGKKRNTTERTEW